MSGGLADLHFDGSPQRPGGGFNMLETRGVGEIEQAVNLRQVPAETPGQIGRP